MVRRGHRLKVAPMLPVLSSLREEDEEDATFLERDLRAAVAAGDVAQVQALLEARADASSYDADGRSCAAVALAQGPHRVLGLLLSARADPNARDSQGRALVHVWSRSLVKSRASMHQEERKLAHLAGAGADMSGRLPESADTPLHIVSRIYNALMLQKESGALLGKSVLDGELPRFAHTTRVRLQLLVDARADPLARNVDGVTALDLVEPRFRPSLAASKVGAKRSRSFGEGSQTHSSALSDIGVELS